MIELCGCDITVDAKLTPEPGQVVNGMASVCGHGYRPWIRTLEFSEEEPILLQLVVAQLEKWVEEAVMWGPASLNVMDVGDWTPHTTKVFFSRWMGEEHDATHRNIAGLVFRGADDIVIGWGGCPKKTGHLHHTMRVDLWLNLYQPGSPEFL